MHEGYSFVCVCDTVCVCVSPVNKLLWAFKQQNDHVIRQFFYTLRLPTYRKAVAQEIELFSWLLSTLQYTQMAPYTILVVELSRGAFYIEHAYFRQVSKL